MPLPPTLSNRNPYGAAPALKLYALWAAASATARIELIGRDGGTIHATEITVAAATAGALQTLYLAASGATAAKWALAVGAIIKPSGGIDIRFNTGVRSSDGTTVDVTPDANTIDLWEAATNRGYSIGWGQA